MTLYFAINNSAFRIMFHVEHIIPLIKHTYSTTIVQPNLSSARPY